MPKSLTLMVLVAIVFAGAAEASGNSIGVNFTATRFGGGPYPILAHESAGLVPQVNWNNSNPVANGTTADIGTPLAGKLVDNTGIDSGAHIQWINANAEVNSSGGNTTPNERLYRGVVEGSFFDPPFPQLQVIVSDVPYSKYDVIAYLAGFSFAADASVKLGSQEFYYIQSSNFTVDGFIPATATTYASRTLATYAVFPNLNASSFTLEIIHRGGNRGAIAGLQIVAVPEPSTWALAVAGLVGLAVWRVRRGS
jgi:MYXO-CTERM domain-containing protein